jgi:hypothetical protein
LALGLVQPLHKVPLIIFVGETPPQVFLGHGSASEVGVETREEVGGGVSPELLPIVHEVINCVVDLHPDITAWMTELMLVERYAVQSGGSRYLLIGIVEEAQAYAVLGVIKAWAELYTVSAIITVSRLDTYRSQVEEKRNGRADREGRGPDYGSGLIRAREKHLGERMG